ncbi:protein of unknown function [Burkholderia multivorans]
MRGRDNHVSDNARRLIRRTRPASTVRLSPSERCAGSPACIRRGPRPSSPVRAAVLRSCCLKNGCSNEGSFYFPRLRSRLCAARHRSGQVRRAGRVHEDRLSPRGVVPDARRVRYRGSGDRAREAVRAGLAVAQGLTARTGSPLHPAPAATPVAPQADRKRAGYASEANASMC